MWQKFKSGGKLLAIWGAIFASFLIFSLYQDIRENKLFNYTETYASSEVLVKSEQVSINSQKYTFEIVAHDNYLGSIAFNYYRLKDNPGQVIFRIREVIQSSWYAENRYDFSYFNSDEGYQFGFPEIANSKDKRYLLEFEFITPSLSEKIGLLDLKTLPILTAKYVFPRNILYSSPGKLATILIHRSTTTLIQMDYLKIGLASAAITVLIFLAINRSGNRAGTKLEVRQIDLQKNMSNINPFFVPAAVLIILVLAFTGGNFLLAERMAVYLWITLLGSAIFYSLQVAVLPRMAKFVRYFTLVSANMVSVLDDLMTKKIFLIVGILFILISGFSSIYYLGGDDSRLFYLYPNDFLTNYASKIVSDTGLSQLTNSIPPTSLAAFVTIMTILKKVFPLFNLQALLISANLVGGFFAFYLLVSYLIRSSGKHERVICMLSGFMYVFSIFNFYTLLNSRLIGEYLISLFPLSLLLGIKAVREGKFYLLVLVVVIWSAFSLASVTLPLSAAAILSTLPLLVFATLKNWQRLIGYLLGAAVLFLVLNLHWLVFVPFTNFSQNLPGSSAPSITSSEFRQQNARGIKSVAEINNSFFPLLNSYHQKIQFDFHWPQLPIYTSWYAKTLLLGYLLVVVVILAGFVIDKDKSRTQLYIASVISFVLAIYFFTVNISFWGTPVFLWLSNHIPGFVVFRNMYDKFAYGLAFQWALVTAVSLAILIKSIKTEKYRAYLLFAIFIVAIINAKPFILGEFQNLPYWTTKHSFDGIKGFNRDYLDLIKHVKGQDTVGRFLSLPLLTGNSVIVQDERRKDHYYAGVSPLLLFTGKNDMSGIISFSDKASQVFAWLTDKDYESIGHLLQQYNVQHIIVSNITPDDLQNSFMFSDGLFHLQTKEFIASVSGAKIKDFGSKYSLYKISPRFHSEKIYITDTPDAFTSHKADLTFTKNASHSYTIEIDNLSGQLSLVFLDPYLKNWQLLTASNKQLSADQHHLVFDYANMWEIDPQIIKNEFPKSDYLIMPDGSMKLKLRLYFQPYDYFQIVNTVSISAYLLSLIYVLVLAFRRKSP